jgi:flagellin
LSSGFRINSAKDDAAGLQISNRMTSQINGLNIAVRNANDGISLAQTAEGAMQESTNILQRMRDLSVQAANGSNSSEDRASLQKEVVQLQSELTRIADTTTFGGQKLLDGSYGSQTFQVGAEANQSISMTLDDTSASALKRDARTLGGNVASTNLHALRSGSSDFAAGSKFVVDVDGDETDIALTDGMTAKNVAEALNAIDGISQVGAATYAQIMTTADDAQANDTISFDVNGVSISYTAGATVDASATALFGALTNSSAALTAAGVSFEQISPSGGTTDDYVQLSNTTGEDIAITNIDVVGNGTQTTTAVQINTSAVAATTGTYSATNDVDFVDATPVGDVVVGGTLDFTNAAADNSLTNVSITAGGGSTQTVIGGPAATTATLAGVGSTGLGAEGSKTDTIASVDISTAAGAQSAIDVIDAAIAQVDDQRSTLGALQNRFESTISNLTNISENVSAARSRIRDVDFAQETAKMSQNQILQQAGTTILAQANQLPQAALSLLG